VCLLFLATLCLPSVFVIGLLIALSVLAHLEFYRFLRNAGIPSFKYYGTACGALIIMAAYLDSRAGQNQWWRAIPGSGEWEVIILMISVLLLMVRQFPQKDNTQPLATISCTLCGILYVPFLLGFFIKTCLAVKDIELDERMAGHPGAWLIWYPIFVAKVTDAGAFFTGMAIGRHKLFPRLSSAKTWEGLAGGLLSGAAISVAYFAIAGTRMGPAALQPGPAAALGAVLGGMAILGDLAESQLKRASSMKDSGAKIPGIGGMLDLIDSVLFVAPAFFVYLQFVSKS